MSQSIPFRGSGGGFDKDDESVLLDSMLDALELASIVTTFVEIRVSDDKFDEDDGQVLADSTLNALDRVLLEIIRGSRDESDID